MQLRLLLAAAALGVATLLSSCGSGPAEDPANPDGAAPNTATGSAPSSVDATRFVFGAVPGKSVVYWIHTDW